MLLREPENRVWTRIITQRYKRDVSKLTTFRLGSGAALASLSLVILGVAGVQGGPRWEVPVAALEFFFLACMSAVLLCVLAMWSFVQLQSSRSGPRRILASLSAASAAAILFAAIGRPGQWPITHPALSGMARRVAIPVLLLCITTWLVALFVKSPDNC